MTQVVRILVTGDREWSDEDLIFNVLSRYQPSFTTVIDGHARGADKFAHWNSERLGMATACFPAYWDCKAFEEDQGRPCKLSDGRHEAMHGKPAGAIRNSRMLSEGKPTEVAAFHDDLKKSKGTLDMVTKALKSGLLVTHYTHEAPEGTPLARFLPIRPA